VPLHIASVDCNCRRGLVEIGIKYTLVSPQPLASCIVTLYIPGHRFVLFWVVFPSDQWNWYGARALFTVRKIPPLQVLKQQFS